MIEQLNWFIEIYCRNFHRIATKSFRYFSKLNFSFRNRSKSSERDLTQQRAENRHTDFTTAYRFHLMFNKKMLNPGAIKWFSLGFNFRLAAGRQGKTHFIFCWRNSKTSEQRKWKRQVAQSMSALHPFHSVCIYLIGKSISSMVAEAAAAAAPGVLMVLRLLIGLFVYSMAASSPISAIQIVVRYGQVQNGFEISAYRFATWKCSLILQQFVGTNLARYTHFEFRGMIAQNWRYCVIIFLLLHNKFKAYWKAQHFVGGHLQKFRRLGRVTCPKMA